MREGRSEGVENSGSGRDSVCESEERETKRIKKQKAYLIIDRINITISHSAECLYGPIER